ncbi:MAG: response regulator [Planctomycetaceae bacterium]|nr:response regulator [Planctomycetaceae bacterium]
MIRVLVVEDDIVIMNVTCKYLKAVPGFEVVGRAFNGEEAKEFLAEGNIDLIILDIFMPRLTGVDFLAEIRARNDLSDVIFVTASNDTEMINRAVKLGIVDYLIKPFSRERFNSALENYRAMRAVMVGQDHVTQEQLDSTLNPTHRHGDEPLLKGMHPKTLEKIRGYINRCSDATITQQEIADRLGLSKVTVRRYMEYLVSKNEVAMQMEYGTVGRPAYTYRKLS